MPVTGTSAADIQHPLAAHTCSTRLQRAAHACGAFGTGARGTLARLITLAILAASAAPANGGPLLTPTPQVMECRKAAAQRFINDFVQIGPPQERIEGSQIITTSFRNDNPFEDYVDDCLKRRNL